jgi:hypothetical protein
MTTGTPPQYRPPRQTAPVPTGDPLEIELVYEVSSCGTCSFFWPSDPSQQPYGPYPAFDLTSNAPVEAAPDPSAFSFPWLEAMTAPAAFPNPEVMDGCRKAPVMTIGINPNMTAFAPGRTGASWCYPNFSTDSDAGTDLYAKTAYYYRYRSVYQERFDLEFSERYMVASPRVVAPLPGAVVSAERPTDSPSFELKVRYDGDFVDTTIPLAGVTGGPQWVVLFDTVPPSNRFEAGDVLAAQLDVPAGIPVQLYRQQVGYYEQFVPVLELFQSVVRADGHAGATLAMGEDVCQLDMVACASPHWNPGFLGGSSESERTIVDNCVTRNHWAISQLVQTRPAVLYLVGEATFNMFNHALGGLIDRVGPLSPAPADGAFTLLRETTDPSHPCYLRYSYAGDGGSYELQTRLVVTPHFSYSTNFTPQYRLGPSAWQQLQAGDAACSAFLQSDPRVTYVPGTGPEDYSAFLLAPGTAAGVAADLAARFPGSAPALADALYDPHAMMASVLAALYADGEIAYGPIGDGSHNGLTRTGGGCQFCVNDHWRFPLGCPYGKPAEAQPPAGLLRDAAGQMVATGRPAQLAPAAGQARASVPPPGGGA